MRKTALAAKGLAILLFCGHQNQINSAQDFGKLPLRECWRLESDKLSDFTIASDNVDGIFLSLSDGSIRAVEKDTGKTLWYSEIGGEIVARIISDQNRAFVVSRDLPSAAHAPDIPLKLNVNSLSTPTGITSWEKSFSVEKTERIYLLDDDERLFIVTETGRLTGLDKESGKVLFDRTHNLKLSMEPVLSGNKIYFGAEKRIVVMSASTGLGEDEIKTENKTTALLRSAEFLYTGDQIGNVVALDASGNKRRWDTWTGAEITSIVSVPEGLLVSSFDNYIYLLSEKSGKRIWKKRLTGRSVGTPVIKDGVAVFSVQGGTEAAFIDLKKGRLINQITLPAENFFINNPVVIPSPSGGLVVFQTFKGILAFGSERDCGVQRAALRGKIEP